jgi:hypothetical protein
LRDSRPGYRSDLGISFAYIDAHLHHLDTLTAIHMASMKSHHPIFELTEAETLLVSMAARLLTALRYKEATPGGDFSHFAAKIEEEMVCRIHTSHS